MKNKREFYRQRFIVYLLFCLLMAFSVSCVSKVNKRMQENFEGEALNFPPPQNPLPNPPADVLTWTQQFMQPRVVERPGGGRWVQVNVKENYFTRNAAHLLQAYSEDFTLGINGSIRGNFTLRLVGSGTAFVFLYTAQGENLETSPIGGYAVREGINSADVAYMTSFDVPVNFSNPFPRPNNTFFASYKAGQILEFTWSIDQRGPFLYMNVSPGGNAPPVEIQKVNLGGKSNIPIQKIMFIINAYDFQRNTTLFVDNIAMEEY